MTSDNLLPVILLSLAALHAAAPLKAAQPPPASRPALDLESAKTAHHAARPTDAPRPDDRLEILSQWHDNRLGATLVNAGPRPVRVRDVVILSIPHRLPPDTALWGEGFQMVTQTGGTLARPVDLGFFTDRDMYRIPQPPGATTVYNVLLLSPPGGPHVLMGFSSCRRFSGSFNLYPDRIEAVLDAENLEIRPGQRWPLEELILAEGPDPQDLLAALADRIAVHHPPLRFAPVPTGWCSWYCFGPDITADRLRANIDAIRQRVKGLRYFQIDDGYQAAMGDWLATRDGFGGDLPDLCHRARAAGLEPALWVAPFIAEADSRLFREHPDWFVRDENGRPLRSDRVTFGGWRRGPWYALDGSHPEAARHLENLFRTLRQQYGCTYFKLDANFWGALHGGRHDDPDATRIEAYRRGMEAIRRGAGDAFLLGCNHPLWPSLGLIHGARCSMDVESSWESIHRTGREALRRNWQHGRLWLNDPDVLRLAGHSNLGDMHTRAAIVLATGGLVLAGDDLAALPPDRLEILQKVLPPAGVAARFNDDLTVGTIDEPAGRTTALFNWTDQPVERLAPLPGPCRVRDFWTHQDLGLHTDALRVTLPPRSGRLLLCTPAPP